jgi:hypothetical protein
MASGNLKSVTDGLLVSIDTNNLKSYVGPPLQNLLTQIGITSGTGTGYVFTSSTTTDYVPVIQLSTTVSNCFAQNTGSSLCCPNLFQYGDITGANVTGSTLYTYMLLYYSQSGYTNSNYLYRYEYNSGTYVTESGIFSDANRIDLGSGWYWAWGTFTTQATTNRLILYSFYYRYSSFSDRVAVARAALFKGSYTGLTPLKWPPVNTTRTATNSLFNLNGGTSYDITNMTVGSNGDLSFNGSTNYIPASSVTDAFWNAGSWTASVWVKFTSVNKGSDNAVFGHGFGSTSNGLHLAERSTKVYFGFYSNDLTGNFTLAANTWYNITWVFNYSTKLKQIYVNGNFDNSGGTVGYGGTGSNTEFGRYPWSTGSVLNGSMPIINLYNRVLTASEILQNYNATKSRFGL